MATKSAAAASLPAKGRDAKIPKSAQPRNAAAPATAAKPKAAASAAAARAKAPPDLPAKAAVVSLKTLAIGMSERLEVSRKEADAAVNDVFGAVIDHLKAGDKIRIGGLGIIEIKSRPARMGRNPATGAQIQIAASRKVAFRAAKELKEAL